MPATVTTGGSIRTARLIALTALVIAFTASAASAGTAPPKCPAGSRAYPTNAAYTQWKCGPAFKEPANAGPSIKTLVVTYATAIQTALNKGQYADSGLPRGTRTWPATCQWTGIDNYPKPGTSTGAFCEETVETPGGDVYVVSTTGPFTIRGYSWVWPKTITITRH